MKKFDPIQIWLDNVAYSHSKSEDTERNYRSAMRDFCAFLECTPQQIIDDYQRLTDREFRKKYSQLVKIYISRLSNQDYAVCTVKYKVTPVKSFFKYNDLPLGYIPMARRKVTYHNRDITKREIVEVINISNVRDRAFYTVMAQSGQRPFTLCQLKLKHIDNDKEFTKGIIPCKIEVPEELAKGEFGAYFSFMSEESVKRLREYFRIRGVVGPEDYIFAKSGSDTQLNRKSVSFLFAKALDKLKVAGTIDFKQIKSGKQRDLRLYNLRKYFRNHAKEAGVEYVNFWMGHKADYKAPHIPASDAHYFSREDVEFQRELYREKAMPFLRLETATPSETEKTIEEMRKEIEELRQENLKLKKRLNEYVLSDSQVQELLKRIEKLEKQASQS